MKLSGNCALVSLRYSKYNGLRGGLRSWYGRNPSAARFQSHITFIIVGQIS